MTNHKVDLKVFIRNFVNRIPKDRDRRKPLICLEFKDRYSGKFNSRIAIYRIESLSIIWYKFIHERNGRGMSDWPVMKEDWKVINIVPPPMRKTLSFEGLQSYESLAVIQVEHFNG